METSKTPGIAERLAAAKAATSGPAAAALITGNVDVAANAKMLNTVTAHAVNAAAVAAAKLASITKPVKTSPNEVLFHSKRPHLGSATKKGIAFRFTGGYLLTSDAHIIAFIRENATHWGVTEEGA